MALDLEEQEQIDELKTWWKQHGVYVLGVVFAFVVGVSGWKAWNVWTARQAGEASALFERAMQATSGNDAKGVKDVTGQIMENHARSGYATPAAWLAGKVSFNAGDLKSAEAQYRYALDHAKDPGLEQMARLRLAAVLVDLKRNDEALKLVDTPHDAAFVPLYAHLKGDILALQGKTQEARAAYKLALDKMDGKGALKALVEIKLDSVGG